MTGYQAQGRYQFFRGPDSAADSTIPPQAEQGDHNLLLIIGDFSPSGDAVLAYEGPGFSIFNVFGTESE